MKAKKKKGVAPRVSAAPAQPVKAVATPSSPPPPPPAEEGADFVLRGPQPSASVATAEAGDPQFVGADDLREIIKQGRDDARGREAAEIRVRDLEVEVAALTAKLQAARPVRVDAQRVEGAANVLYVSALMDVKGVLNAVALTSATAARALLRIQNIEAALPAAVTAATVLVQRAKALAESRRDGLEVSAEALADLLDQAERLL